MSVRVHTAQASELGVKFIADSEQLVDIFGVEFDEVPVPVLVIEDGLNGEAWIITGTKAELSQLAIDMLGRIPAR